MLTAEEKTAIISLIHRQVVPAIGCTEPIAVALCVAKARELLGSLPESVDIRLSANILKNAMGVGIPGTGMTGLPIAVALGALIGRPELELEVLQDCNREAVERGKRYIAEGRIRISLEENAPDKLYIAVTVAADGLDAEARIATEHANFVYLRRGDNVIEDKPIHAGHADEEEEVELTLRKVYEFATETDVDDLRFILQARDMNERGRIRQFYDDNSYRRDYEQQVLTAMSLADENRARYYDSVNNEIQTKWNTANSLNMIRTLAPNIHMMPNGQMIFVSNGEDTVTPGDYSTQVLLAMQNQNAMDRGAKPKVVTERRTR